MVGALSIFLIVGCGTIDVRSLQGAKVTLETIYLLAKVLMWRASAYNFLWRCGVMLDGEIQQTKRGRR